MHLNITHRWQAFLIHLGISGLILASIYLLASQLWFPGDLAAVSNIWDAVRVLILVDLVLGPLMTLVVYDRKRKSLKVIARDLAVIALVQIAGLSGGVYVLYSERPLLLTLVDDSLHVYVKADLEEKQLLKKLDALDSNHPALLYMELPESHDDAVSVLAIHELLGGQSAAGLESDLWRPIPSDPKERAHMLRFAQKVPPVKGCNATTLRIKSKHLDGRICVDFDQRRFTHFEL